ncbi:ubiquitin-specific protease ubp15 [Coemansia javaensis]|uniref:Ubiquitin-specific protease ubp15 n=1 Tax=Coemansia javaensis TaxID=2761396 RepID=A0A9W8LFI2_9FUNG|nr:ubiquitin-specific protease ubp15 [Coemansia javaensis]
MSRAGTPLEAGEGGGGGSAARSGGATAVGSPDPVYRFYLSPPPSAAPLGQGGAADAQGRALLGMLPLNPYMAMSPGAGLGGVSAFGHPGYYAPVQHPVYYPSAYGLPAAAVQSPQPQPQPQGVAPRASTISAGDRQAAPAAAHGEGPARVCTPIVNEAGVPVGGFGADQEGQYIEIKFPTFGQAQVQQMLQQLHIQQQHLATPVSAPPSVPPAEAAARTDTNEPELEPRPKGGRLSIYDGDAFGDAHMEDIVFERKAFFWRIESWDKLERRATSEAFKCGGFVWRILLRPFGSSHKGVLSLFLECLGPADGSDEWRCICRFVLAIANPHDPAHNTHGSAYHCFHRTNPNWGFTRFMKLADLRTSPAPDVRPYIEDGACTIAAYLHVIKDPSH